MKQVFDIVIVGKGMIGSAAAKYMAQTRQNVLIIGPDEPKPETLENALVFSSHYDQARVQRLKGRDSVWSRLNLESAQQYPELEQTTGIRFQTGVGCLYVSTYDNDPYFDSQDAIAGFPAFQEAFEGEDWRKSFPAFSFPDRAKAYYEEKPSGYINPLALISAQLKAYSLSGGKSLNETVVKCEKGVDGNFMLETNLGSAFKAKKVLLATGAFVNQFNFLHRKLKVEIKSEVVVLGHISESEAKRLADMPSLLYETETETHEGIYLLPPVQYPDEKTYIKLGCNIPQDQYFTAFEDMQRWFKADKGNDQTDFLSSLLSALLPKVRFESFHTKRCIITRTAHKKPYIGEIGNPGLFVATGGNGYGAMSSDALGHVSAHLVCSGTLPEGYTKADFMPVWA